MLILYNTYTKEGALGNRGSERDGGDRAFKTLQAFIINKKISFLKIRWYHMLQTDMSAYGIYKYAEFYSEIPRAFTT